MNTKRCQDELADAQEAWETATAEERATATANALAVGRSHHKLLNLACADMLAEPRPRLAAELRAILKHRVLCPRCKRRLPVNAFAVQPLNASGRRTHCRDCTTEEVRALRVARRCG